MDAYRTTGPQASQLSSIVDAVLLDEVLIAFDQARDVELTHPASDQLRSNMYVRMYASK